MKYFTFLLLLLQSVCYSQNLVPNGGFEEHTACPETLANLDGYCNDWFSYAGTCDYFNSCSQGSLGFSNPWGFQEPHGGQAYSAFIAYHRINSNTREHLGCALTEALQIGETYYISFYVNNCFQPQQTNIACNRLGFKLMTHSYSAPNWDLPLHNDATYNCLDIISDTVSWTHLQTSFVADSNYTHLVIGNFFDDAHTDTLNHPSILFNQSATYYIDDVCVSKTTGYCDNWTGLRNTENQQKAPLLFPNPTSEKIEIQNIQGYASYEIFSDLGKLIQSGRITEYPKFQLDLSDLPVGAYFIKLFSRDQFFINRIIKIE